MEFWGGLDLPCVPLVDGCGSQLCEGFPVLVEVEVSEEGLMVIMGASVVVEVATVLVLEEVASEVEGAGLCLRRTSVTANTALLASMGVGGMGG